RIAAESDQHRAKIFQAEGREDGRTRPARFTFEYEVLDSGPSGSTVLARPMRAEPSPCEQLALPWQSHGRRQEEAAMIVASLHHLRCQLTRQELPDFGAELELAGREAVKAHGPGFFFMVSR